MRHEESSLSHKGRHVLRIRGILDEVSQFIKTVILQITYCSNNSKCFEFEKDHRTLVFDMQRGTSSQRSSPSRDPHLPEATTRPSENPGLSTMSELKWAACCLGYKQYIDLDNLNDKNRRIC